MPESKRQPKTAGKPERMQRSRPQEGEPVDIPVPKRKDFDKLLERATKGSKGAERSG